MVDKGLQPQAIGISIAAPCVAVLFVILRLYSRSITRNLNWDDAFIVLPMILSIGFAYTTVKSVQAYFIGYHAKDVPIGQVDPILGAKYGYAAQLLYNPILAIVKNGVLVFYLRLGGIINGVRRFTIALMVFNTAMMVAVFLADMFQCVPISKVFYADTPGTCIDSASFFVSTAALTILTDLLVLSIPTWIMSQLQMELVKKVATIFLLSLGLIVTGTSAYRLYYTAESYYGPASADATYSLGGTATGIEVNLAIITACGPFLKPVVQKFFPRIFGQDNTTQESGNGSSTTRHYGKGRGHARSSAIREPTDIYGDSSKMMTFELSAGRANKHRSGALKDSESLEEILGTNRQTGIVKETRVDISYESN